MNKECKRLMNKAEADGILTGNGPIPNGELWLWNNPSKLKSLIVGIESMITTQEKITNKGIT